MQIPTSILAFWRGFETESGGDVSSRFYEAFYFADSEAAADKLADLVLAGTKRATASLVWALEAENKVPPRPGDLSVITSWKGDPLCVIETKIVEVVPFEDVSGQFAASEGEGDKSLRHWREAHWAYFGRDCQRIGREPSERMPVLCEQFAVVYRGRARMAPGRPQGQATAFAEPGAEQPQPQP